MKKINTLLLAATSLLSLSASAQIGNSAPYCRPMYQTNYNMFNNIKIKGTTLSFGAAGDWTNPNEYIYYNTTTFPSFVKGDTASVQVNVYAAQDAEPTYFALWIDYNQNNIFESSELVMQNSNTSHALLPTFSTAVSPLNITLTVPATATIGITRARLTRGGNTANMYGPYDATVSLDPCPDSTVFNYGNTYDFNINITGTATAAAPVAAFTASATTGTTATVFNFTDGSTNTPTTRAWTFTPATVSYQSGTNAASANPSVKFTAAGTYTVKLKVSNATGADSLTKTGYITVTHATGIGNIAQANDLTIFPNPAQTYFTVDLSFTGAQLNIMDMRGRSVLSGKISNSNINIATLPSGSYVVKIVTDDAVYTQRLIKNK